MTGSWFDAASTLVVDDEDVIEVPLDTDGDDNDAAAVLLAFFCASFLFFSCRRFALASSCRRRDAFPPISSANMINLLSLPQ